MVARPGVSGRGRTPSHVTSVGDRPAGMGREAPRRAAVPAGGLHSPPSAIDKASLRSEWCGVGGRCRLTGTAGRRRRTRRRVIGWRLSATQRAAARAPAPAPTPPGAADTTFRHHDVGKHWPGRGHGAGSKCIPRLYTMSGARPVGPSRHRRRRRPFRVPFSRHYS